VEKQNGAGIIIKETLCSRLKANSQFCAAIECLKLMPKLQSKLQIAK